MFSMFLRSNLFDPVEHLDGHVAGAGTDLQHGVGGPQGRLIHQRLPGGDTTSIAFSYKMELLYPKGKQRNIYL